MYYASMPWQRHSLIHIDNQSYDVRRNQVVDVSGFKKLGSSHADVGIVRCGMGEIQQAAVPYKPLSVDNQPVPSTWMSMHETQRAPPQGTLSAHRARRASGD